MKVKAVGAGRVNGGTAWQPNGETSVFPPPRLGHVNGESPPHDSIRMEIALVTGSTPHLSAETRDLLRSRLRIVASLLFTCFLAYIVRWVFHWNEWNDPVHYLLFSILGVVAVVLALSTLALCRGISMSLTKLRISEILVFGAPALFFLALHYFCVSQDISLPEARGYLPNFSAPWLLLIFTYAMFIPNSWQRATAVMAAIGAAPIAVSLSFWLTSDAFRRLAEQSNSAGYLSRQALFISASVLIGAIGVRTIGTLRRAAFTARQLG
jgi:serine/threonine-protein kinase